MVRILKSSMWVALVLTLIFGSATATFAHEKSYTGLEEPVTIQKEDNQSIQGKAGNGNDETPGEWFVGDAPTNPVPNAPVLLFVPGLNNIAQIFWEDNDMRETAREAGYQTAFVQLHDAGGASADMWDNGELLAEKVKEISEHFDDRKVAIIAYSKGGVDTHTAMTYYGASEYVDNVITLSSPHHGSQLADLAYSSWAGWLADLIGATGDGTYSLQMGNMEEFRTEIDNEPGAYAANYYTLGGTDWGSMFSSTWFGGTYLSQYGSNDGVVTTASSALPGGQELAIGDWNHTSIRTGETFSEFENYLMAAPSLSKTAAFPGESVKDDMTPTGTQWVHGGPLEEGVTNNTSISIEENVAQIQLQVLTSEPLADLQLKDATGKETATKVQSHKTEEGVFAGAYQYSLTVEKPEAGEWELTIGAKDDSAYLLVMDYDTQADLLQGGTVHVDPGQQVSYQLNLNPKEIQSNSIKATYHITQSNNPANSKTYHINGQTNVAQNFSVSETGEVYNITIDIEGLTKSGKPFKRTIIDSVYVD